MSLQWVFETESPTVGAPLPAARRIGTRLLILTVVVGLVAAGVAVALASHRSAVLARATIELDGERVDFELRESGGHVEARVWEGVGLLRSRHVTTKEIYEMTPEAARKATFRYDAEKRSAEFTSDEGGVVFLFEGGSWGILPWVASLD